jgi:hypothetical protein
MLIFISLLGAVLNKIRGGTLTDISENLLLKWGYEPVDALTLSKTYVKPFTKQLHAIVFGLLFAASICSEFSLQYALCAILLYAGMIAGASFGWGGYMTSAIDRKIDHNQDDVLLLDKWFRGNDEPVLSGWAALTVRGFMWTLCISTSLAMIHLLVLELPIRPFYITFVGFSMGSVYLLSMEICQRIPGKVRGNGWQVGELAFGAVIWGSMAYFLGA